MESLLGQLLHHKDPRTQALLSELIQDQCARDLLMHDLRTASQSGYGAKPRKSWKLAEDNDQLVYHYGAGEDINTFPNLWDPSASLHGLNTDLPSPLPFSASPEYKVQKKVVRGSPVSERNEVNQDRSYRIEDYSANFMPLTIYPGGSSTSQLLQISNLRKPLLKYSLSTNDDSPKSQADSSALTNTKELVGQASLNHKFQVQYHGPSSGLNLIAKFSRNYHNGYWRFPEFVNSQNLPEVDSELGSSQVLCKPIRTFREESELYYRKKQIEYYNLMNPIGVFPEEIGHMNKLLDYYWENVHPIFPILNKLNFLEQFNCISQEVQNVQKHYAQKTKNNEQFRRFSINEIWFYSILKTNLKNQSSEVSIPILLVMFSLASKYLDLADNLPNSITEFSDRECHNEEDTDRYLHKAEESIKIFIDLIDEDQNINLINCQTLLLLSYRRMGSFSLSKSWSYAGMAIRMAQHLGLHKDLKAHYESCPGKFITSQTLQKRKLIWWACVKIDKHLSSCAGKPTMIFERDYDISILIEDENEEADDERGSGIKPEPASPSVKCFNCSVSLSILVGRTLANLYPIRPKIIAESDEALLPLLDQNFARWYIELPNHLIFDPNEKSYSTKKSCVEGKGREEENPKPEVLTLHAQFYTALILLHRPFLEKEYSISHETKILHSTPISSPGKNNPPPYQSHSICAASAKAIKSIFKTFRQIFGFKKISPLMIYYLYSAIAIFAYDSHSTDLDEKYRLESQEDLSVCVNYLLEISVGV
ncbi:fungal-specific transcription factor domain-domain-containing protein [Phakopsora pachyrhizi]|uniref:Fungal-specific transcription factor domain-domain-containing protein n=1 Tax=Phakopsora pachyrhizi TaxID=170000 RepID=A0AAV0BCY6_PHAPC|nr:fungal-specific transcription factor domain-domain-containing protein [Phakopsora pachyrhizi]